MKKTSVFLALGSILLIIIEISMFVKEEGLFATSVFFLLGGVAGIVVFWFIFYFGWSEPKNNSSRDSKQI